MSETDEKIEIQVTHANASDLTARKFFNGLWWVLVDAQSKGSFITGIYRVSAYQS